MVFDRAYTNFAICSASRNSFMTSRRSDQVQVWNFINDFRQSKYWNNETDQTMPQYFKSQGYLTLGAGKLFHYGKPPNEDLPWSWSDDRPYWHPYVGADWNATLCPRDSMVCVRPDAQSQDNQFADYNETVETVNNLRYAADQYHNNGKPFFIGLGVTKPHAKWNVPERYFREYMNSSFPLPDNIYAPSNQPEIAFTAELDGQEQISLGNSTAIPGSKASGSMNTWNVPNPVRNDVPSWASKILRAGYYSAVSLADYHLGMVLDELEALGLSNNTIVIMFADHGYSLMEHTELAKHTNFETALRVPLMIRVPWLEETKGTRSDAFVELLDVFPTLVSLAKLDKPSFQIDGDDVSSLLTKQTPVVNKTAAFSQYSRCPDQDEPHCASLGNPLWCKNNCEQVLASELASMGYSVRTSDWRYTGWYRWNGDACTTEWDQGPFYGEELYKHTSTTPVAPNFDDENANVANQNGMEDIKTQLRAMVEDHFRSDDVRGCPPDYARPWVD
eukprot:TRINITY_DN1783_c0_g1_i2.p1 TRINITY_DN1783_c0_g1~~TRINITY_DN1783_c0_g1_i2.p1  ORF type:complete len:562 (+),score=107.18 TRINITY_DN1783_c0_g1_i2:179-1687(+)